MSLKEQMREKERRELVRALESGEWKLVPAAERLGMEVSSLQRVLGRHPDVEAERKRRLERRRQRGKTA